MFDGPSQSGSAAHSKYETTGGAKIGWVNASGPLAKLIVTSEAIHLNVLLSGKHVFPSDRVISVTLHKSSVSFLPQRGIQIHHNILEYPERIVFWCVGKPDQVLARISETGFRAQAPAESIIPRSGLAVRWQVTVAVIFATYALPIGEFISSRKFPPQPGPLAMLAIAFLFVFSAAAGRVESLQKLILKPDRSIGEMRSLLNLLQFIAGIMLVILSIIHLVR